MSVGTIERKRHGKFWIFWRLASWFTQSMTSCCLSRLQWFTVTVSQVLQGALFEEGRPTLKVQLHSLKEEDKGKFVRVVWSGAGQVSHHSKRHNFAFHISHPGRKHMACTMAQQAKVLAM